MERPGGIDRPEPPPRRPGRDHPSAPATGNGEVRLTRSGWEKLAVEPYAERMKRPDVGRMDAPDERDTPRAALERFRPERAGLEPMTLAEADAHIAAYAGERPCLRPAVDASPGARIVLASADKGRGHALERHEGAVTPDQTDRRVRFLEDPAVTADPRTPGEDRYKPTRHKCGVYATRIADPDAFAVCLARAVEHPLVRSVLDGGYDPDDQPVPVTIPLAALLGPDGYKYCDGHRLLPHQGSMELAIERRAEWVRAFRDPSNPAVPEPQAARLRPDDFKESVVPVYFCATRDRSGWEIASMYVQPRPPGGGA